MNKVMNNRDLRRVIFSFFRSKEYKECEKCKKVLCCNDGTVSIKYVHWGNFSRCYNCFLFDFFNNSFQIDY